MLNRVTASAALLALWSLSPAVAQSAQSQPTQSVPASNTNVSNKNEKICENITPIGSRLATKRFCGTRAEWEDRRRQDREAVENAQRSPCVLTHNSGTGRPAC
ncbi:MAG TPA: hypothetical protein VFH89_15580 [Sphingomicrobium sp.]|nr:hypothetical protein [Sphingomicrobium sp.]